MNNFETLNSDLTTKLKDEALTFVLSELKKSDDGIDTSILINLILSSHISSLFTCMKVLSEGNEEMVKKVDEFMIKTADFMKKNVPGEAKVYPY